MGSAQMALDRRPLCQTGKRGKNCPKPSWQALTPPGNMGQKVPQTILASLFYPAPGSPPEWRTGPSVIKLSPLHWLQSQHVDFFGNFLTVEVTHFCLVEYDKIIKNEMVN